MSSALWYFGRATGTCALVLLSLAMVLGIVTRSSQPLPGLPRFAVATVHRTTSLTAVSFLGLHVGTLWLDPYAQLRLVDALVPFGGAYRPFWQGLGTVAADLVVALIASSLLRHRIGLAGWRVLHRAAYLCWPAAIAHALGNGTDRSSVWMLAVVGTCVGCVGAALAWRLTSGRFDPEEAPVALGPPAGLAGLR